MKFIKKWSVINIKMNKIYKELIETMDNVSK